jgi:hypothetical protein
MGVLDDAIREHLDLKRQHGATEDEIAQKEAEALGPARRHFPRPAQAEDAAPEAQAEEVVADAPAEPAAAEPVPEPVVDPVTAVSEPAPEPSEPPLAEAPPAPVASPDTEEYRFEDELPPAREEEPFLDEAEEDDEEEGDDDPLEDTPEFLQETPEHDRLWFEQKPPRDFDFD